MPTAAFYTLGCKVNQYETDSLAALVQEAGYDIVPFDEHADVYIINTCTITATSDKKSRQSVARAYACNPDARIAVIGCYAQRAPKEAEALPGVHIVLGTQDRRGLIEWLESAHAGAPKQNAVADVKDVRVFEHLPPAARGAHARTRAQLKVQDGCDSYCSYCAVPYARGPARSLPLPDAHAAITRIAEEGTGELVFTGVHLMSYGRDLEDKPSLAHLIAFAAAQPGIGRVRLGSLEPAFVDDDFVDALAAIPANKLCLQFHLPLQSGSADVLARMRRKYTPDEYRAAASRLRRAFPACALTTDIIAGFPGETSADHALTLAFMRELAFARLHVFPYSARTGTAAAALPGHIRRIEKDRRAREITALGKELERAYLHAQTGAVQWVLPEECREGWSEGYTGNYARARFPGRAQGLTRVRVLGVQGGVLLCSPAVGD